MTNVHTDQRTPDQRTVDQRNADPRTVDNRTADQRNADENHTGQSVDRNPAHNNPAYPNQGQFAAPQPGYEIDLAANVKDLTRLITEMQTSKDAVTPNGRLMLDRIQESVTQVTAKLRSFRA